MNEQTSPRVVMVKKRLENGAPCRKCIQAEEMLRRRELWDTIDEVMIADESDATSAGMVLAKKFGIEIAPFFVVGDVGREQVFDSVIKVSKEVLGKKQQAQLAAGLREKAGLLEVLGEESDAGISRLDEARVREAQAELAEATPQQILSWALDQLGQRCALAFSGAEDVVLIDMASKLGKGFSVFCLDTGRLHAETYRFIDMVRQFYGIEVRVIVPEAQSVEDLVQKKGLFSFYEEGHGECCSIRKIAPLRKVLAQYDGWATGQRRDQSPTRVQVPVATWDRTHFAQGMLKVNPLAAWSGEQVWTYIRDNGVPYNQLHDQGFVSVGCEPCTRALRPGEHERAARWWWEDATKRECGLHAKA